MSRKQVDNTITESNTGINGQYKSWFLDYASYVILERAVPAMEDGLKPVQRRILHAMNEMDDGRFNKVANIIGQSMQYHPHGDASIGDALVNMGQKDLLIDTQGNWGDVRTGDDAAASRYIEARLSKLALEITFNSKTTRWQLSYDGRKQEPVTLPMKFPLVLAQGAEGIAVGLATKILPHNFIELCEAAIRYLKGKPFQLLPDFQTGGMMDATHYNDGKKGGKIRVRAIIEEIDKKMLVIRSVPFGVTTSSLIESIIKANDQGKIKIKKVTDETAAEVQIFIELASGISPDITIDALYAFTDCEVSISPNICVIEGNKPHFYGASDLLTYNAEHTKQLLGKELEIRLNDLQDKWHFTSLEKIFFEEKIYQELEARHKDWETVIAAIDKAFQPFLKRLRRPITREEVLKLTEKPVRRIYRLDIEELNVQIRHLDEEIAITQHHLAHLNAYAIQWYENLIRKFGKGRERKTEIRPFDVITAKTVAIPNTKLYINYADGFVGTTLKKDELLTECSTLDDIIVFNKRGLMKVVKVAEKTFVFKDILHAAIFRKNDDRTTYNMIYADGETGISYAKRFNVTGITRDKEYDLTKGADKSKVHYFSANANGEAEIVRILLSPNSSAKNKELDYDFTHLEIRSRSSLGNQVVKHAIRQIRLKEKGKSTLAGRKLWFDPVYGRLNEDEKGQYLGTFENEQLLVLYYDGNYELTSSELSQRFDAEKIMLICQFDPQTPITAIYLDAEKSQLYVKRFRIETSSLNTKFLFIKEGKDNSVLGLTLAENPTLLLHSGSGVQKQTQKMRINDFVDITGWKAIGNKLSVYTKSTEIEWMEEDTAVQQQLF